MPKVHLIHDITRAVIDVHEDAVATWERAGWRRTDQPNPSPAPVVPVEPTPAPDVPQVDETPETPDAGDTQKEQ